MGSQQITIDLAKTTFNFSETPNLHEIKEIRFDNCTEKFEIPLTINDYPNITKLSFYGASREDLFETPNHLEQFTHIKHLTLWSFCNFNSLKEMLHIESLHTVVQNTKADTQKLVKLFPNVKELEIWGSHLKKEELPEEIGQLSSLEILHLVSCGIHQLPDTFAHLKKLKELHLRGLPMNTFPEVITKLSQLEILEFICTLHNLPESLTNLKRLKRLNLSYALNGGNMDVAGSLKQEKLYLKPIPNISGQLENLEDLDLSVCGVFDISPITSLNKLKKLDLQYSALKNCDGFSNFTQLEELNLETSYDLKNLDGLKGLPIKKLNLSSNYMESIEVIASLESLEILDIKGSNYIKDYTPIYNHPTIKELEANTEILKNLKNKDKFKTLPSIDVLITQLETEDVLKFEETILNLSKHVKANYSDDDNPLARFFGIETEEEEITEIPVLDLAIEKHLKNLSNTTLVTIFEMSFKSVGYDNFNAALLVLKESIARKDIETQKKIVKKFYKACEYYDAGHRFWGYTVHDQLIDDLFAQFTSEALYQLLKKASTDMLNSEGGDQMEDLFMPAFQNTTNLNLQKKLLKLFFKYEEEARTYFGKGYFDALLQQIKDIASPELEKLIAAKKEENKEQEALILSLENLTEDNLPGIIEMLGKTISKKLEDEYLYNIVEAVQENKINEEALNQLITFLIKKKENSYLAKLLQSKYHNTNPEKIISILNQSLIDNLFDENEAYNLARMIITDLVPNKEVFFNDLEIYRDFIVSKCNVAKNAIYNDEVQKLLSKYFNAISNNASENYSHILEKIKEIFSKTEAKFSYSNLYYDVYYLVSDGENEQCRTIFNYLSPRIKNYSSENILYLNVIAAIKLNDSTYFNAVLKEVQKLEEITQVLLAFNLACGFAHFGRKEEMLFYIKESIRLGKTKQQFLDDTDFEKYWNDEDFLMAIEE